jgi:hypothetical protein
MARRAKVLVEDANSAGCLEHFQANAALAKAGVESGFPSENATMQVQERFLFPALCV